MPTYAPSLDRTARWLGLALCAACCLGTPVPASAQAVDAARGVSPLPPRPAAAPPPPATLHSIGFGVGYVPGPGLHAEAEYAYRGLEPGTVTVGLGWSETLFGSIGYGLERELDPLARRRLTLLGGAFSETRPNRLLEGPEGPVTDERRTGVRLRTGLAVRPERLGGTLNAFAEGRRVRVRLDAPAGAGRTRRVLTTLEAGALYLASGGDLARRVLLTAQARLNHDDGLFAVASTTGSLRQPLGSPLPRTSPLEAYFEGRAAWASAGTPAYERVSFGGPQLVRGYRKDAFIGFQLWSLQSELWLPIPGVRTGSGLAAVLDRHLRVAGFLDVGGIYEPVGAEPGMRTGAGAGARLLLGPATVRIDWATGLTPGLPERARGTLYVSVTAGLERF